MNPFIMIMPYTLPKDDGLPYATVVVERFGDLVMLSAQEGDGHVPIAMSLAEAARLLNALNGALDG